MSDAASLLAELTERGLSLAVAESLTGGRLAARLVDVPGASRCFRGGVVAYDYAAKSALLGVDADLLARSGAVHEEVAVAMAEGARRRFAADHALATTGVAGPGPDERGVAAGTVVVAHAGPDDARARMLALTGNRDAVRSAAVDAALDLLAQRLGAPR